MVVAARRARRDGGVVLVVLAARAGEGEHVERDEDDAEPGLGLAHRLGGLVDAVELGALGADAALGAGAVERVDLRGEREAAEGRGPPP